MEWFHIAYTYTKTWWSCSFNVRIKTAHSVGMINDVCWYEKWTE